MYNCCSVLIFYLTSVADKDAPDYKVINCWLEKLIGSNHFTFTKLITKIVLINSPDISFCNFYESLNKELCLKDESNMTGIIKVRIIGKEKKCSTTVK